jgi:hypothetical protein
MQRTLSALALLSVMSLASCSDNGTGSSQPPNLTGTWTATAIAATPVSGSSGTQDLYADGFRLTFTFQSNGSYTIVSSFPGDPAETNSGTYAQSGSDLTLTESGQDGEVTEITVTVNGSTATFIVKDIDIDGTLSDLTVTLRK